MIRTRSIRDQLNGPWVTVAAQRLVANRFRRRFSHTPFTNSAVSPTSEARNSKESQKSPDVSTLPKTKGSRARADSLKQGSPDGASNGKDGPPASWRRTVRGAEKDKTTITSATRGGSKTYGKPSYTLKDIQKALKPVKKDVLPRAKDGKSRAGASNRVASTTRSRITESLIGKDKYLVVKVITPQKLQLIPVEESSRKAVPNLSHNLDRVLFNQGVYQMQDERSNVFNFDPYLASIMPVKEFDFDALKAYITSSKDVNLRRLCVKHKMKYCGSTSSMTSMLSHFHFLLSAWRPISYGNLSQKLDPESPNVTLITRAPAAAFARLEDCVYAIDADKQYDTENVLSQLGKSMEKLLTLPKEEFEKYRKTKSHEISEEERNAAESYHYTTMGDFLMRSQLDAHDARLPGTGMFDLKTRAVITVRMDVHRYQRGAGYEIRRRFGQWESFEREYHDMIRSAFLKYSLQVRMGRMDGIFVAFHNTQRIFGFQYISLAEMDEAIHGTNDLRIGDQEFKCSIAMLNDLMDRATARFPGRTLRLHVETRPAKVPLMYFFAEPVTEEEMERNQAEGKPFADKLEQIRLSVETSEARWSQDDGAAQQEQEREELDPPATGAVAGDPQGDAAWRELMRKVEEMVENESMGIPSVRDSIQGALEQNGLLQGLTELESEKCLNEMVAVLTSHLQEGKDSQELLTADDKDSIEPDGLDSEPTNDQPDRDGVSLTDLIMKVTETMDDERQNLQDFRRAFVDLAIQSRKLEGEQEHETGKMDSGNDGIVDEHHATDDGGAAEVASDMETDAGVDEGPEVMGLVVTIRNKVDGRFVKRAVPPPTGPYNWTVEYAITEVPETRVRGIYNEIQARRRKVFDIDPETRTADWYRIFGGQLPRATQESLEYRKQKTQREAGNPIYVAWDKNPLAPETARARSGG